VNAQPAGPMRSPADSPVAVAASSKVRGFVADVTMGTPVSGVIVCLEAALSEGVVLPLGVLSSDHAGYFAFALPRHLPPGVAHLWVYPYRDAAQKLDCLAVCGNEAALVLRVSSALATDALVGVGLASIQRPDARDWELSPLSFVTRASLKVGEGGCETFLPDSQAERELHFQRVVRISTDASSNPSGYGSMKAIDARYRLEAYNECAGVKSPSTGQPENGPIRFGRALEFRQRWSPVGHSLGQVVYSLPLAPCESVDIAVIEWSRQDTAVRRETDTVTEQLLHEEKRDRMIDESVNAALSEQQGGWDLLGGMSTAGSASASATIPISGIPVNLAGSGSMVNAIGGGIAQSWGDRSLTGDSMQDLHDLVTQATSVQRSLNSTVIVQSTQAESNVLQTRTVTNHNHCHALTVQYYEILRHFRVTTGFVRRRDVVLIPYAVFTFDWRTALRFESILREVLLDDAYADCFDAIVRQHCCPPIYDAPPAQSPPPATSPPAQFQTNGPFDVVKDQVTPLTVNAGDTIQMQATGQVDFSPSVAGQAGKQNANGRGDSAPSGGNWPAPGLSRYSLIYKIGNSAWQQGGVNVSVPQSHPAGLLSLWVNDDNPSDNVPVKGDEGFKVTVWVTPAPGSSGGGAGTTGAGDGGAPGAYSKTADECCEHRLLGHLNSNLGFYNRAIWLLQDALERRLLLDAALAAYPKLRDGLQDRPVAVDGNYVAYVWNDPDVIWLPSTIYPVGAYVTFAGLRYQCIERHQARIGLEPPGSPKLWQLEDEIPEALETIMSLPTRGVFAEAQLGHCNACEVRDVSRFWQWEQSPCEQPPQISDITPGPRGQPETPQPTPLPAPVVQIAQAPAEPDPVGLAAALKLLGTPNISRDMSGLSETSKLLDALTSGAVSLAQARNMASQAKQELAKAASGSGTSLGAGGPTRPQSAPDLYDKLQVVKTARDQGLLTDAGAQSATQRYLQSDTGSADIIPAGYSPGAAARPGVAQRASQAMLNAVDKLIEWGIRLGKAALASETDKLGTALSDAAVEIAKDEITNAAVGTIPFAKAFKVAVRYSLAFADGAGKVIVSSRDEIQKIVDEGAIFSDESFTQANADRIQKGSSYYVLGLQALPAVLEAGLASVIDTMLQDAQQAAVGLLSDAAGAVTQAVTDHVVTQLLKVAKVDRVCLAAVEKAGPRFDYSAIATNAVSSLAQQLVRQLISSTLGSSAQRARLTGLVQTADPLVELLRGLLEVTLVDLDHPADPLADVWSELPADFNPQNTLAAQLTVPVGYEFSKAASSVIADLTTAGWAFGSHTGYTGITVDATNMTITLPDYYKDGLIAGPPLPPGQVGMLQDELQTDEWALLAVSDGLDTGIVLRALGYQADIDAEPTPAGAWRKYYDGYALTQADAGQANAAFYSLVQALQDRYSGTEVASDAKAQLVNITHEPATLTEPTPIATA
jgi:Carbohydrate-binding module family 5/12